MLVTAQEAIERVNFMINEGMFSEKDKAVLTMAKDALKHLEKYISMKKEEK